MIKVTKKVNLRNERGPDRHEDIELAPDGRDIFLTSNGKDEIKVRIFDAKKTKKPLVAYIMTLNGKLINDDEIILSPVMNELTQYLKSEGIKAFYSFSENEQMYIHIKI